MKPELPKKIKTISMAPRCPHCGKITYGKDKEVLSYYKIERNSEFSDIGKEEWMIRYIECNHGWVTFVVRDKSLGVAKKKMLDLIKHASV